MIMIMIMIMELHTTGCITSLDVILSFEKIVATLRAGVEYAGVLVQNCVLIAGSRPGVLGAECLGLPCVFLRSSLTSRAECRSAKAILDDFGEPDLTVSKLRRWWP
ncbi:hypothetical protein GIB67_015490 [Kingdonia uniflora]|uniref:Uncharacterized protein n=1 Tax=Kingdonia uniflora TaxID=39325 RepID=A0A7J7LA98_9MAGN|nr:hypothetical protein GIB67_015490 [Kingdonia uniflora]